MNNLTNILIGKYSSKLTIKLKQPKRRKITIYQKKKIALENKKAIDNIE